MQQMSAIAKDRVLPPVDLAVWWVEYVLRHKGAKHLRPATLDLHWTQYIMLDVAIFVTVIISIIVFIVYKLLQILFKMLKKQTRVKIKTQ